MQVNGKRQVRAANNKRNISKNLGIGNFGEHGDDEVTSDGGAERYGIKWRGGVWRNGNPSSHHPAGNASNAPLRSYGTQSK